MERDVLLRLVIDHEENKNESHKIYRKNIGMSQRVALRTSRRYTELHPS